MDYRVQLEVYEGPLDLLLELIEQAELDITKVALAHVADQYLNHIRQIEEKPLVDISSFIVTAARLLQIKSEALLPRPPEREPGEEDPGDELARQLLAYKRFKQIGAWLNERQLEGLRSYLRIAPPPELQPKLDLAGLSVADLQTAVEAAYRSAPRPAIMDPVLGGQKVRIRDQIGLLLRTLRRTGRTTFRAVFSRAATRLEIVVSFLAVLELIKQRRIEAQQESLFGEIDISPGENWSEDQEIDFELEFDG